MQTEEKTLYQLDGVMIGKRIKSVRKARGLTQEQLAERCGCTSTHISNIENGKIGISIELLYTLYAKAFEKCLTELAAEVYGIHEPFEIAQRTLRTACEFYEADWCGMFDADMMLDLWMPFWWYNRLTGGMTTTQLEEGHVIGSFEMFRKMIMGNADCYLPEIDTIRFTRPEEYALFKTQDVKSFLAVPY